MDFFDEVNKKKEDFPMFNSVTNEVKSQRLNFYQKFAIGIFVLCFFLGIIFGNLFSTCEATSYFYSDTCLISEFNFSVMISIWFLSLLVSIVFYAIGQIVTLLTEISEKLNKIK